MGAIKNKIFVLHGWTYSSEKWGTFLDLLTKENLKAEVLKIPGLTGSIKRSWTIDDYVGWLKRALDKEKGKVILIGHSNGGRISLWFANKYPEKIKQLILIDSAGIYHSQLPMRLKRLAFKTIAKIGKKITSSKLLENLIYKVARAKDYKESSPVMKRALINLTQADRFLTLASLEVPTLIIWGKKDTITPLSDGLLMHKKIKNSKLVILDKARHSPQFTHPKGVVRIITEQLNSL